MAATGAEEDLNASFSSADFSTEQARSREIPRFERELKERAEASQKMRSITGWFLVGVAALTAASGAFLVVQDAVRHDPVRLQGPLNLTMGAGEAVFGAFLLTTKSRLMDNWLTYSQDPSVQQRSDE